MAEHESDPIAQLEQLERFFDDEAEGVIPFTLLTERGIEVPPSTELSDQELHERLRDLTTAMGSIGMYLDWTDHMSDRELYDYLREDVLQEPTMLFPDDPAFADHISPIGGFSEEDNNIYMKFYADDETRERWLRDFPDARLPDKEAPPHDRDRFLPKPENRILPTH